MISVTNYLMQTRALIKAGRHTDGCTTPFKTHIHRWLSESHLLCAAHDYGSLGYITGVRSGWHNNLHTLRAHCTQSNPIYWVWGVIVSLITLPWVVWRRNWGFQFLDMTAFYIVLMLMLVIPLLIKYQPS